MPGRATRALTGDAPATASVSRRLLKLVAPAAEDAEAVEQGRGLMAEEEGVVAVPSAFFRTHHKDRFHVDPAGLLPVTLDDPLVPPPDKR